ncbi:MAG TPA: ABC transporter permease, partial [Anaerolineae bacterium]|nr:ABC transporter permease [Anaerolineae bacterium]
RFLMPAVVQNVTGWLPMTLVVTLLQNLWFGLGWNAVALAALGGILLVGTIISLRTFRWE